MKLEEKYGLKTIEAIFLIFVMLLTLFGFVVCIINIFNGVNTNRELLNLILYVLIIYYFASYYSKPHGNLLKYIILGFGAMLFVKYASMIKLVEITSIFMLIPLGIIIALIGYFAGRLNAVKKNQFLTILILVLITFVEVVMVRNYSAYLITSDATGNAYFLSIVSSLSPIIMWIDVCATYFVRFRFHKEAGADEDKD